MKIEPLNKKIYEMVKGAGVKSILLSFSGGSDEGYLYVSLKDGDGNNVSQELEEAVEEWAWSVYEYCGAGDGHDYGDDIIYDLEKGEASHSDWYMARKEGEEFSQKIEIAEEND